MYGLVNKALKDLILHEYGDSVWDKVKKTANFYEDMFITMEPYPDQMTYDLVVATSKVLDVSPEKILEAFGEYWILYTAKEGYGELLTLAGKNLPEFLLNLDTMHSRVGLSFPYLNPPSFECSDQKDGSLILHYHSQRLGLAPMVIGLLKGLGKMFKVNLEIEQIAYREKGDDCDKFFLKYK